ncbi:MAG: hypothetical protein ACHQ6V_16205 [Myxococcota bacterium]
MTPAEAISDERARELAAEIATRSEYAQHAIPDPASFQAVLRWFRGILDWIDALYSASFELWLLLLIGLLLTALALLAHVVWTIRLAMRANEVAPGAARAPDRRRLDLEAESLAGDGRYLDAAHAMHLACIEQLVQGGVVELRRHDPNPTLRARLARARLTGEQRGEFLRLLDWLEQRWFRDPAPEPRDAELFAAWRALHARLGSVAA